MHACVHDAYTCVRAYPVRTQNLMDYSLLVGVRPKPAGYEDPKVPLSTQSTLITPEYSKYPLAPEYPQYPRVPLSIPQYPLVSLSIPSTPEYP